MIPLFEPPRRPRRNAEGGYQTKSRGLAVLTSPALNKGTAFTAGERKALGLTGLLPPGANTLDTQVRNAYIQYGRLPDALSKSIHLTALRDCNEVLFYRLFSEHLREMIPVFNDPAAGMAMEDYRQESRRPRGVYLSIDHPGAIEETFDNLRAGSGDIDLILATDGEHIPGLGDCGVGGIEAAAGKLAIYTAAAGIDPHRAVPVMLDMGTNRLSLLEDPTYLGNRHPRIRGGRYDAFVDAYIKAATAAFPHALLLWQDFAPGNAQRILNNYRDRIRTFNEDMQGSGVIALAAAISAIRVCGTALRNQRVVVFGAGAAGMGIAGQIHDAMVGEGLSKAEATRQFWCVDRPGLLTTGMDGHLRDYQAPYARPCSESRRWKHDGNGSGVSLDEVVRRVRPTMLIGASGVPGSFTKAIIGEMAAHTERPIVFVLSNPASSAEASPSDLIAWTNGRALIATGAPFSPVTHNGLTYAIAQLNDAMLCPGLCLGAIVSGAARISDGMLAAAANAVSSLVAVRQPGSPLLPQVDALRGVSMTVAVAVAETADAEGLSGARIGDVVQLVRDAMWQPEYPRIEAI